MHKGVNECAVRVPGQSRLKPIQVNGRPVRLLAQRNACWLVALCDTLVRRVRRRCRCCIGERTNRGFNDTSPGCRVDTARLTSVRRRRPPRSWAERAAQHGHQTRQCTVFVVLCPNDVTAGTRCCGRRCSHTPQLRKTCIFCSRSEYGADTPTVLLLSPDEHLDRRLRISSMLQANFRCPKCAGTCVAGRTA